MTEASGLIGVGIGAASPAISAIADNFLKPRIVEIAKNRKLSKLLTELSSNSVLTDYLHRARDRQSHFRTLAFQNESMKLEQLYLPLTVVSEPLSQLVKIDTYRLDFLPRLRKIIITDMAGMGKSTLLRFMFLNSFEANAGIPVFLELRQLAPDRTVLDALVQDLKSVSETIDIDLVSELIRQGNFIFFLDGFDEITFADRDAVTTDLQTFISKAGNNDFIISSRPEEALSTFADFNRFSIKPLEVHEAFLLLKKYDRDGELSSSIIERLMMPEYSEVREFLSNPLLVSLLYRSYQFENDIPLKKHIFYRQVYDALFSSHDTTKPGAFQRRKHSGLDKEQFHTVLRHLGLQSMKIGKVEYGRDELVSLVEKVKSCQGNVGFSESDLILDLITTVPLFVKDGDYYRWNHKSIQEYFFAQYICRDAKALQVSFLSRLTALDAVPRYWNVLDMCYDMDYNSFRNSVVFENSKEIIDSWDSSYSQIDRSLVDESQIDLRKALTWHDTICIFPSSFVLERLNSPDFTGLHPNTFEVAADYFIQVGRTELSDTTTFALQIGQDGSLIARSNSLLPDIMKFLEWKKNPIVTRAINLPIEDDNCWDSLNDYCDNGLPTFVTDDPASALNSPYLFSRLNSVLSYSGIPINIDECKRLVEAVSAEKRSMNIDVLLDGI